MIRIRDVSRVTHVVADREAALALYRDVFGAKVFYEGPLGPRAGNVTLLTLADTCVEIVDPFDLGERPRSYLERYGGFLRSFTFKVDDAAEAAAHLRAAGIGVVEESPGHCTADPERTFGTIIEFSDADLPNDPRREPGFYERSLEADGSMGAQRLWSITLLADDLDAVDDFFGGVLGGVFIGGRTNGIYATASHFFVYERARISVLKPRRDNNVLSSVIDRQGAKDCTPSPSSSATSKKPGATSAPRASASSTTKPCATPSTPAPASARVSSSCPSPTPTTPTTTGSTPSSPRACSSATRPPPRTRIVYHERRRDSGPAARAGRARIRRNLTMAQVRPIKNGPYMVTGVEKVTDSSGKNALSLEGIADDSGTVFLCRCGQSATKPFCDGTHASTNFESDVTA